MKRGFEVLCCQWGDGTGLSLGSGYDSVQLCSDAHIVASICRSVVGCGEAEGKDCGKRSSRNQPESSVLPDRQDDPWAGKLKILARGFDIDSEEGVMLGLTGCGLDPSNQQHLISDGIGGEL